MKVSKEDLRIQQEAVEEALQEFIDSDAELQDLEFTELYAEMLKLRKLRRKYFEG